MNILYITIEPSTSNWWKLRQRPTAEHWTELPKSSWSVGGMRISAKRSRPWWVHPLKQFTWVNGSSPTPAREGKKEHRSKQVSEYGWWLYGWGRLWGHWQCTRIYPYSLYWHFWNLFFWMDTLLNLDIVGRALDLPQSNVPYFFWGVDGDGMEEINVGNGIVKKEERQR